MVVPRTKGAIGVDRLVDELFRQIEMHQGFFHTSDGETFETEDEFFRRINGRLAHGLEACRKMRAFLHKYGRD